MSHIHFADLFCGAGLFSEGFRANGFIPTFAVDLDQRAIASYNRNVADVASAIPVSEQLDVPEVDLVIAGPPCQGFSTLGRRDAADERNQLSLAIPLIAARAGARVVVVENVPPFLSSSSWLQMAQSLEGQGYGVQVMVLDAQDFGTPQTRQRAFTIASKIGPIAAPTSYSGARRTVGDAFADIHPGDPLHVWPTPSDLAAKRFQLIPIKGDKRDVLRAAPHLCPSSWVTLGAQATDVWGRMNSSAPSNTLRCRFQNPSTGRYIHPTQNRVISLREGARLQGVPDHWSFAGDRSSIQRQIGNGVPVPLASAIARSVLAAMTASAYSAAA